MQIRKAEQDVQDRKRQDREDENPLFISENRCRIGSKSLFVLRILPLAILRILFLKIQRRTFQATSTEHSDCPDLFYLFLSYRAGLVSICLKSAFGFVRLI